MRHFLRTLVTLLGMLGLVAEPPSATAQSFYDGVFSPAHWVVVQTMGGGGQLSAHQPYGGHPDDYLRVETTTQAPVVFAHFNTTFVADPAAARIDSVDFSIEVRNFLISGQGMGFSLALEQGGSIFAAPTQVTFAAGTLNWLKFDQPNLHASQFSRLAGSTELDFSRIGSPITFGFATSNVNGLGIITGYDNFAVTVAPLEMADFDDDDDVDGSDFLIWQRQFELAEVADEMLADANHDGRVDQLDLGVWREGFGTIPSASTFVPADRVPEPSGALWALGWFLAARRIRPHGRRV
jgi:hypothetical protein